MRESQQEARQQLIRILQAGESEFYNELIQKHIGKMWGGLEMASILYFVEKGRNINGSFRENLIAMMKEYGEICEEVAFNAARETTRKNKLDCSPTPSTELKYPSYFHYKNPQP